jgi:hypothetical protein
MPIINRSPSARRSPSLTKSGFGNRRDIGVNFLDLGEALTAARDYKAAISAFEQGRGIIEA